MLFNGPMKGFSKTSHGTGGTPGAKFDEIHGSTYLGRDERGLARLGRSEVLKRRFGLLSIFGFSCFILATWKTILGLFTEAFENGGPAALPWGFPIVWISSLSVYLCLGEMASIAPISGGPYFWVAILAPRKYERFCGYLTGWLTSLAWVATLAMGSIFTATIIQGLIILNYPEYELQKFHGTLLAWTVIVVCILVNTVVAGLLPLLKELILFTHVLGSVAILIVLVYISPHNSAEDVFFRPLNEGLGSAQGISYLVGFIGNVATFVEIENPAVNVPQAMFTAVILNGSAGWAMLIAILFCLGDIDSVLNTPTGYPFIQILYDGVGRAGATAMTILILVIIWCAVIRFASTASRMVWAFARDRGLPFHRFIGKVHPRTRIPILATVVVTLTPCLLNLIYIASSTAFNDLISISVSSLYASYLLPCSFLLWRRVTGQIRPHRPRGERDLERPMGRSEDPNMLYQLTLEENDDSGILVVERVLEWGPWFVPGLLGTLNNAYACVFCVWVLFWGIWPPTTPVTAENMNYSVVITGSVMIFAVARYFSGGKVEYRGTLVDYGVKRFNTGQ
ncbi:amino acid/polyamine transporter I [Xylaria venustula]|nr:amino acid/polyamine transporter I [Xylaria venustula]